MPRFLFAGNYANDISHDLLIKDSDPAKGIVGLTDTIEILPNGETEFVMGASLPIPFAGSAIVAIDDRTVLIAGGHTVSAKQRKGLTAPSKRNSYLFSKDGFYGVYDFPGISDAYLVDIYDGVITVFEDIFYNWRE